MRKSLQLVSPIKKNCEKRMTYLRKAEIKDLPEIMTLISEAKRFLGKSGSDQWQGAYPAKENIEEDITNQVAYILEVDGKVAGYSAVITGEEPNYTKITDGSWTNDSLDYVTVHRIALSDEFRGHSLTKFLFSNIFSMMYEKGYRDFRVDTHEMNQIMQHVFEREGFEYRGQVIIDGERRAYQKEL